MKNILSFDIEEHFQVSGMEAAICRSNWDNLPSRVEKNTHKLLDILERNDTKATFFILGWIAKRHPELIKAISGKGHEIACHGYEHRVVNDMPSEQFAQDVQKTKKMLEDIIGDVVYGYRAPSFSLSVDDMEKFEILAESGFIYDSSLFPIKHFRYGRTGLIPLYPFDITKTDKVIIKEFPLSVINFMGKRIPAGGGGYFRLYPDFFIRRNFTKVMDDNRPVIIYLHPWEFDPDQPRISGAGTGNTFRHYLNLHKTESRLDMVLKKFKFGPFRDYIDPDRK